MEGSRPHAGRAQTHTRNTNHIRTQATQGKPRTYANHARTQITHTPWWDRWMYPKAAVTCLPGRSKQHLRARRPQNPSPRYRVKPPVTTAAPAADLHHSRSSTYMMWSGIQSRSVSASVAPSDAVHAGIPVLGKVTVSAGPRLASVATFLAVGMKPRLVEMIPTNYAHL